MNIFVICLFLQKQHARFELNLLGKFGHSSVYTVMLDEPYSFGARDKKFVYKLLGMIHRKMRKWEKNIKMAPIKISLMTEVDRI
jgi:hypothetical protein